MAITALAVSLTLVSTAEAFKWHLGYGQAKHATKVFAEETCRLDHKCIAYAVGPCDRASDSRVDCLAGLLYKGVAEPGDEVACNIVLHWGVSRSGEMVLKKHGRPDCRPLEPQATSENP
jgi:hypothetical protein